MIFIIYLLTEGFRIVKNLQIQCRFFKKKKLLHVLRFSNKPDEIVYTDLVLKSYMQKT